jgi:hypothetical protein
MTVLICVSALCHGWMIYVYQDGTQESAVRLDPWFLRLILANRSGNIDHMIDFECSILWTSSRDRISNHSSLQLVLLSENVITLRVRVARVKRLNKQTVTLFCIHSRVSKTVHGERQWKCNFRDIANKLHSRSWSSFPDLFKYLILQGCAKSCEWDDEQRSDVINREFPNFIQGIPWLTSSKGMHVEFFEFGQAWINPPIYSLSYPNGNWSAVWMATTLNCALQNPCQMG